MSEGGMDAGQPPPVLELSVPAEPASVSQIRAAVRGFARAHGAEAEVVTSIALAVSEAATNAVVHAFVDREPGALRAVAQARVGELVVSVRDDGRGMQPRADSPGLGIGLPLIGQLTSALDIRATEGGGTEVRMTFAAPGVRGAFVHDSDERMRLIGEVSRLASGAGWPADGVESMVELFVPALVDVCAIDVVGDSGAPERLAARVAGEPELADWLVARPSQARYPASPTYGALDRIEVQTVEITDELVAAAATGEEDLAAMRRLPARWWVTVPLREGGRAHGLLHFGLSEERGRPSADDVAVFERLGERATRGLANKRLIDDLRRTRSRLEQILGSLAEAVTVQDADGRIVYANPAAVELLEAADVDEVLAAAPGEMAARFEITHEDGTPVSGDSFPGRRLVRGEVATPLLMRMVHRVSGRERWVLVKATLLDEEGPFALNVIADVTETRPR